MKKVKKTFASFFGSAILLSGTFLSCAFFGSGSGSSVNRDPVSSGELTTERLAISAPEKPGTIQIAGGGTYTSLKLALEAAAGMSAAEGEYVTIEIAPGTYEEEPNLEYKGSANIHLKGTGTAEYGADVRIIGSGSDYKQESKRSVLEIYKGDWIIENITIEHKDADTKEQAEALGHQSNGTLAVKNCSFISRQDTIRTQGKAWFYQCYIEGTIDFLWMETPGKVALYEDCRLRAVTGHVKDNKPVKSVYFAAPRASSKLTEVFKGLVMYNCILEVESGLDAYFARNPWNKEEYFSTFYNQVAVVASKVYGEVNSDIWKYKANGTANQQFVGFKTDESFHESSSRTGARLTARQVADEYSGRRGILNRYYDLTNKVFSRDSGSNWDIDELIEKAGWKVAEDTSKDKLDTDVSPDGKTGVTWDFASISTDLSDGKMVSNTGYADDSETKIYAKITGGTRANGDNAQIKGTVKIPVVSVGDTVIVVPYGDANYVHFKFGESGAEISSAEEQRYNATADDVAAGYVDIIATNDNNYYKKIVARYTTLPNKPVVTGPEAEVEYIFNNYTDTDGSYVLPTGYLKGTSVSKSGGNSHGWAVTAESKIEVTIPASSSASTMISVLCCDYGSHGNVTLKAGDTEIGTKTLADDLDSNTPKVNFVYTAAEETVITITFDGGAFIHGVSYKPYDKLAIPTYTVTFDANQEGVTPPVAQTVEEGGKAIKPEAPSKEGMTFDGWYTAATEGTEVTFTETITSNVTYYGHWTAGEATLEEKAAGFSFVHNDTKLSSTYEGSKGIEYGIEFDGTSGKIAKNGDNFFFNTGSVINVKVAAGCTVVPVYHNAGNSNYTISERNAETGVVSITSNANNYLMGFMVVPDVDTTKNAVIDLGTYYTMEVQNHYAKGDFITLNMKSGKFRPNGGGNAQINAGSIIEIPVAAGAVVDCTWYSGATSDNADITYSADHSTATITIKAGQDPYIKTVTITY